nr:MAG TPA: hypothetical protein [Caudoviricetes sp.]
MVISSVSDPLATIKNITHDNYRLRICVAFFISGSRDSSSIRLVVKSARWA